MLSKINKIIVDGLESLTKTNIFIVWLVLFIFIIILSIVLIGWSGFLIGSIISKPIQWLYKRFYM